MTGAMCASYQENPRLRPALFRVLALGLGLGLGLTLSEGGLRVLAIAPRRYAAGGRWLSHLRYRERSYWCYPSNPHGEFGPLPDVSDGQWVLRRYDCQLRRLVAVPLARLGETPWCVEMRLSSNGLRDRDYGQRPPPGVVRILGLGDSFAVGLGVPLERSLFKRLEATLGRGYEVVNCAVPGMDTAAELERLAVYGRSLNTARVLLVFLPNDILLTEELDRRQRRIGGLIYVGPDDPGHGDLALARSPELRLLWLLRSQSAMRAARRENIQWYRDCFDVRHNGENLKLLAGHFQGFARFPGVQVALVIHPLLEGLETDYPFTAIHQQVAEMARAAGLPVLDLLPTFRGRKSSALWVHPVDHHPNGRAQALAAGAILRWLRRDLPGFLKPE